MALRGRFAALLDPGRPIGRAAMLGIAAATVLADQLSKWWAFAWLVAADQPRAGLFWRAAAWDEAGLRAADPMVLFRHFFELRYQTNTGAAFSMFEGQTVWLAIFSAFISLGLLVWGWRLPPREWGLRLPFGLILGGALGNLIDRVRLGQVVDFILAHWYDHYWPTFNLADSAVCVGMAWLLLASLLAAPHPAPQAAGAPAAAPEEPTRSR